MHLEIYFADLADAHVIMARHLYVHGAFKNCKQFYIFLVLYLKMVVMDRFFSEKVDAVPGSVSL